MITYSLLTPERTVAEGTARQISLSTKQGEITLRPGHAELTALLAPGVLCVRDAQGEDVLLSHSTGTMHIAKNILTILADTAERSEELLLEAIERARAEAAQRMRSVRSGDEVAYAAAAAMLERELARYRVVVMRSKKY